MSLIAAIRAWNSTQSGPFFKIGSDAFPLPTDLASVIAEVGGREGFIGSQYLRLYRRGELAAMNEAFEMDKYRPDLRLFGSDGYGEAFGFLVDGRVVKIPLIPIPDPGDEVEVVGASFSAFIETLSNEGESMECDPDTIGLEVHLKQPICFGGDFRDPANCVLVSPTQLAELSRYWNPLYRELRKQQG